ncbi:uncharacterized protein BT62DRAFT_999550 [Guyanagaster necrorhizus]|uniref:Uncharacterized protein n=1 Tax=Guyanagaster necrorhizus TaxID=856835 RepID=A0A9P7W5W1_9AGAR|nr:uncharacterized protein BT62DRAFT_999550 [Guyanagaster necrorhizus MCA 3950]KAG7451841.1 hypothetical protein BT62DRAFT_999550 [Guyanagaster necrorhizus MCA 3950]
MLFGYLLFFLAALVSGAPTSSTGDLVNALSIGPISNITVDISLNSLINNVVDVSFTVANFIPAELTLDRIVVSAGVNNTQYASFDHTFSEPVVIPFFGHADSGMIENVPLTQGALASLEIVPLGYLDLLNTSMAATVSGQNGIPWNLTGLTQDDVSTTYQLTFANLKEDES